MAESNKFPKDMRQLSDVLRLVSYGCFPRNDARRFGLSLRSYDERLRQARFFLPPGTIEGTGPSSEVATDNNTKSVRMHFANNMYKSSFNYLSAIYFSKSISPDALADYLNILAAVSSGEGKEVEMKEVYRSVTSEARTHMPDLSSVEEKELREAFSALVHYGIVHITKNGLLERVPMPEANFRHIIQSLLKGGPQDFGFREKKKYRETVLDALLSVIDRLPSRPEFTAFSLRELQDLLDMTRPADQFASLSGTRRRASELCEEGLLAREEKGKEFLYRPADHPLSTLTAEERKELLSVISLYKNTSFISFPGYLLEEHLGQPYPEMFQVKNNNFTRILDDDAKSILLEAIHHYRKVSMKVNGRAVEFSPLSVSRDLYNREYVSGFVSSTYHTYRIDHLGNLSLLKEKGTYAKIPARAKKEKHLRFLVHFEEGGNKELRRRLSLTFPDAELTDEKGAIRVTLALSDPQALMPLIRTFYPFVEPLPDSFHQAWQREANHVKEVLKLYEISVQ